MCRLISSLQQARSCRGRHLSSAFLLLLRHSHMSLLEVSTLFLQAPSHCSYIECLSAKIIIDVWFWIFAYQTVSAGCGQVFQQ